MNHATVTWTAVDAKSENKNQEYLGVGVDDRNQNELDQLKTLTLKEHSGLPIVVDVSSCKAP